MTSSLSLKDMYRITRDQLRAADIDTADMDARLLLKRCFEVDDADFITDIVLQITSEQRAHYDDMLQRRLTGEPISKIFGEKEFWGLEFYVDSHVLDPRPDTETIIEAALKRAALSMPEKILDMGTGTGCILISLLHELPSVSGVGIDVSDHALRMAQKNAQRHSVDMRAEFKKSDWGQDLDAGFDMILSNPPYIPSDDITNLDEGVKNHDPILALDGGKDGLRCYEIIVLQIKRLLNPGGYAFLEIGYQQAEDVTRLVEDSGLKVESLYPDLGGIMRIVEISLGENQKKA